MMLKNEIISVAKDQRNTITNLDLGITRDGLEDIKINVSFATVISGIRRCGKSVFLHQIKKKLNNWAYFNFEDTRLSNFKIDDFEKLDLSLTEVYGKIDIYLFDEIQNIDKWEIYIRQLLDKKKKVILTGSNASMLSRELGTRLTGRYIRKEMFPFSFNEYLKLNKDKPSLKSIESYLEKGGFPEFLKFKNEDQLQELLINIIDNDIVVRHNLKNSKIVKNLAIYLFSNIGKEYSYNNLKKLFNLGSINTLISFISYFEDCYLLFSINRFDYSIKKQIISPKKIYAIDNGLAKANSLSFSKDLGRMLENMVFINLRKKHENIFYYKDDEFECDFIIKEKESITKAIQVCLELNSENKKREISGLIKALSVFNLKEGIIITKDIDDIILQDEYNIKVVPIWKWLDKN